MRRLRRPSDASRHAPAARDRVDGRGPHRPRGLGRGNQSAPRRDSRPRRHRDARASRHGPTPRAPRTGRTRRSRSTGEPSRPGRDGPRAGFISGRCSTTATPMPTPPPRCARRRRLDPIGRHGMGDARVCASTASAPSRRRSRTCSAAAASGSSADPQFRLVMRYHEGLLLVARGGVRARPGDARTSSAPRAWTARISTSPRDSRRCGCGPADVAPGRLAAQRSWFIS